MPARSRVVSIILSIILSGAGSARPCWAEAEIVTPAMAAELRQGAAIDADCLKRDVLKEIGACRTAATGAQRPLPVMLGLYFHMWFSDALLIELYRDKKPEVSKVFEALTDAEFPAVRAYEAELHLAPGDLCTVIGTDCPTTLRYHDRSLHRLKQD